MDLDCSLPNIISNLLQAMNHGPKAKKPTSLWFYLLLLCVAQVLSLSEKDVTDLRKSVSELTKKCDELLRHKRFLANQAADSTHFGKASKHKQEKSTAVTVEGLSPAAGAAGAGADGDDDNADDLECAVCRSTMSDELQV